MLVLSRKPGQSILFTLPTDPQKFAALAGSQIEISLEENRGVVVRLGCKAPQSINIVRKELR